MHANLKRKKRRVQFDDPLLNESKKKANKLLSESEEPEEEEEVEHNPYNIKPLGNLYLDQEAALSRGEEFINARNGLGELACCSPERNNINILSLDDAIIQSILSELEPRDLARAAQVSRAFYLFCYDDDLWKPLCFSAFQEQTTFRFRGTWRETFISEKFPAQFVPSEPIRVQGFYSDVLYHSHIGATQSFERYARVDNIERRSAKELTVEQFVKEFELPNRPVIITDLVPQWPAFKEWTRASLERRFGDTVFFTQQGLRMTLSHFLEYSARVREENAMYLFDSDFGEKAPELLTEYAVPQYFPVDYFSVLDGTEHRPSYRWLLIGPKRSGSPFHKDPNSTSAWNGLISGAKKWIFYPPNVVPPGVYPSEDESEVTTPVSVMEWYHEFYEETKEGKVRPIECVQRPGDLIFVPNGWWHSVLNLEESIAVTQNYAGDANLPNVLKFLRNKKKQTLQIEFETRMRCKYPEALAAAEEKLASKKSFWEKLTADRSKPFSILSAIQSANS